MRIIMQFMHEYIHRRHARFISYIYIRDHEERGETVSRYVRPLEAR